MACESLITAEPLVGYRGWFIDDGPNRPEGLLCSLVFPAVWPPGEALLQRIYCTTYEKDLLTQEYMQSKVGIHAFRAFRRPSLISLWGHVVGEVWLWGHVYEHELGWRAEKAYPKCLYLTSPDWGTQSSEATIHKTAQLYHIPVVERSWP